MLPILGILAGALLGWMTATRRGGNTLDKAQYAAGFGITGGIVGLSLGIVLTHTLGG